MVPTAVLALLCACGPPTKEWERDYPEPAGTRIAFGSCAFQWVQQPVFRTIVDLNFGVVEIDWQHEAGPEVMLKAIGLDGRTAFEINLPGERLYDRNATE